MMWFVDYLDRRHPEKYDDLYFIIGAYVLNYKRFVFAKFQNMKYSEFTRVFSKLSYWNRHIDSIQANNFYLSFQIKLKFAVKIWIL